MNQRLRIRLAVPEAIEQRLIALQSRFSQACNLLAGLARETGVWSRVGLHQLGYRTVRERFPDLGAQMACNAIYSVSRACRLVYQGVDSPFRQERLGSQRRPLLVFAAHAPVYFDRHTLSLRAGEASMYTLDGRMRLRLPLAPIDERRFRSGKLLEVALERDEAGLSLTLQFAPESGTADSPAARRAEAPVRPRPAGSVPDYLLIRAPELDGSPDPAAMPALPLAAGGADATRGRSAA
ncbi:MAG: hypothetical protein HYZ20_04170 [Burkholderiales bacterium]|nr:hypothetical protein [Burkholderiales bacterium]